MTRFALLLYRLLLRLAPADLRAAHGDEMVELFTADLEAARERGLMPATRVLLGGISDLARRAPYEHWRRRGRPMLQGIGKPATSFFFADLRFAVRSFARQRGATTLVVVTLALAVAANVAVFALVDAVFVRPLPYPHASRLVDLNERAPKWGLDFTGINYPDFLEWQRSSRVFEGMALWEDSGFNLSDDQGSERVDGQRVTYDMLRVLGLQPALGRSFTIDEDVPNGPKVAMISYEIWQQRFGGARDVTGRSIRISSTPYTIVGVLPPNIVLDGPAAIWVPLGADPKQNGQSYSYEGVGRLKPGSTIEQAQRDLERAHEVVWRRQDSLHVVSPRVMPLRERFVADYRTMGAALGAGVVLVLFIACANVAGAMLARSVFRRRELGIRIALGASGGRLTRQLLTESLLLAAIGGALGTLVGRAGIGLLMSGIDSPPPWMHLTMDARAVAFSILVVLVTTLLFGLVPAIQVRRVSLSAAFAGESPRTAGSLPERRLLNGLVVAEIALAAVLLASGGLLVRGYLNLRNVDPGFDPTGVASFRVSLPATKYPNGLAQRRFYEDVVRRIASLPGVIAAGAVTCAPFSCHWGGFFSAEGARPKRSDEQDPVVLMRLATSNYFKTMGIRLVRGRIYDENEGSPRGPRPVIINEELAKQLWPDGSNPVGKRFISRGDANPADWMTVVGVVKDVRHYGLQRPMIGGLYLSLTTVDSTNDFARFAVVARTSGDPSTLFASIRATVRAMDPELPLFGVMTMRAALDRSMATRKALALWLAAFAGIALTLAIGGIYAVLSYVVGRRRHEIGIRMALGARSRQVLTLVVRQGLTLVGAGLIVGLPAALLSTRYIASLLVGVSARDPFTYLIVALVLVATGALAAWVPARRAASVDPKIVLSEAT
jgi:putative ABC transport system permease protein